MSHTTAHTEARGPLRIVLEIVKRIYALGLIAIVLYLSYRAVKYLIVSLLIATPPPPQIVDVPLRADETLARKDARAFQGITAVENPRVPLARYHRVDHWFAIDAVNGCTTAGCHAPLPHAENKSVRAFLNMHATSMHCGTCHLALDEEPLPLVWYDPETGAPTEPPALLRALTMLDNPAIESADDAQRDELVSILRDACSHTPDAARLTTLTQHFATVAPGGENWKRVVAAARAEVIKHARGEYDAKLAVADRAGNPRLDHAGNDAAVAEYLARGDDLPQAERDALLARVHPERRAQTLQCLDCHQREQSLIDFAALGYTKRRRELLARPLVVRMIQNIANGQTFYMPDFLEGIQSDAQSAPNTVEHDAP